MWIVNFFKEWKAYRIVNKVCKKNLKDLESVGLKRDWFGRLFCIINRDPDVELGSDEDAVYLQNELAQIWQVLVKLNIADILAYELKPLEEVNDLGNGQEEYEHAYLVILTPAWNLDRQYITWKSVLLLLLGLLGFLGGLAYLILMFV